jgi:thiol-disulfide isomerase/thioredoxin
MDLNGSSKVILVHSPSCGACQNFMPVWEDFQNQPPNGVSVHSHDINEYNGSHDLKDLKNMLGDINEVPSVFIIYVDDEGKHHKEQRNNPHQDSVKSLTNWAESMHKKHNKPKHKKSEHQHHPMISGGKTKKVRKNGASKKKHSRRRRITVGGTPKKPKTPKRKTPKKKKHEFIDVKIFNKLATIDSNFISFMLQVRLGRFETAERLKEKSKNKTFLIHYGGNTIPSEYADIKMNTIIVRCENEVPKFEFDSIIANLKSNIELNTPSFFNNPTIHIDIPGREGALPMADATPAASAAASAASAAAASAAAASAAVLTSSAKDDKDDDISALLESIETNKPETVSSTLPVASATSPPLPVASSATSPPLPVASSATSPPLPVASPASSLPPPPPPLSPLSSP